MGLEIITTLEVGRHNGPKNNYYDVYWASSLITTLDTGHHYGTKDNDLLVAGCWASSKRYKLIITMHYVEPHYGPINYHLLC